MNGYKGLLFKYNICFGSRSETEYKKAELNIFKYNICFGSSIQAPIDFKKRYRFKYNICFGSSYRFDYHPRTHFYLNTTFVSVQEQPKYLNKENNEI